MNTDEEQFVKALKRKDREAQKELYNQLAPKMLGVCMRYTHSRDEAQDLLHDGFIKVFENIGSLSSTQKIAPWVKQIMVNTSINYISRSRDVLYADLSQFTIPEPEPKEDIINYKGKKFTPEQIIHAIQSLPNLYRIVFNMHNVENIPYQQIANQLHKPLSTIRSIQARARRLLQEHLNNLP